MANKTITQLNPLVASSGLGADEIPIYHSGGTYKMTKDNLFEGLGSKTFNSLNTNIKTIPGAINKINSDIGDINDLIGDTSISSIGDGTVTGAISTLNTNLFPKGVIPDITTNLGSLTPGVYTFNVNQLSKINDWPSWTYEYIGRRVSVTQANNGWKYYQMQMFDTEGICMGTKDPNQDEVVWRTFPKRYTTISGTYTTATWASGTRTATWEAPYLGIYLCYMTIGLSTGYQTAENRKSYKQIQIAGTAPHPLPNVLEYDVDNDVNTPNLTRTISFPINISQIGQTLYPYIHTDKANIVYDYTICCVKI